MTAHQVTVATDWGVVKPSQQKVPLNLPLPGEASLPDSLPWGRREVRGE